MLFFYKKIFQMIVFSQNFLAVVLFFLKNKQSIGEVGVKGIKRLNEQGEEGQGTLNSRQHVGWQGREGVGATSIMAKMPAWPQSLDRTHTREGKKYRTRRCCFRIFTILINFAYHVIISCFSATTVLTLNQREGDNYCFFFNISLFKNILKLFFITKK
jgi:hypothetical protein